MIVVMTLAAPSKLIGWPKAQISELVTLLDLHSAACFSRCSSRPASGCSTASPLNCQSCLWQRVKQ